MLAIVSVAAVVLLDARGAPPRTKDGRPDLEGIWTYANLPPLERSAEFAGKPFLTDAEAAAFEKRTLNVQNRDRRDGDGPDGRGTDGRTDLDRAYNQVWWEYGANEGGARSLSFDSYLDRPLQERCLGWTVTGPPMVPGAYNNNMELFQTPDSVAIVNEMVHEHRIVPLDGRPQVAPSIALWMGSSRGRWDGDTLIVDTTNFRPAVFRGASATLHLVERFKRVDAETLLYEFTVDDPATWTKPWTVQFPMARSREPIFEYACHEGNYSLPNILAGARAAEKPRQ